MGFPPPSGGGVASVFSRTGAVTAAAGDYTGVASGSVGIANLALASASTVAITGPGTYFVTGTTAINIVNGAARGCVITLVASGQAAGICVILNNAVTANALSLRDNANLGIYAGESVTLVYNGTYWIEAARALKAVLTYDQITTTVNITATTAATANTIVTAAALTTDGVTPLNVTYFAPAIDTPNTVSGTVSIILYLDGSTSGHIGDTPGIINTRCGFGTYVTRTTPSAASHTFSARGYVNSGTGIIQAGAGTTTTYTPSYIQISRAV